MPDSDAQIIERFHLSFLQALESRLDRSLYVLKGGANLRYFFGSVRYSEDIDLDISGIDAWRLEEKMGAVLGASGALAKILAQGGIRIDSCTTPKQTETTQRWKIAIGVDGRNDPVRTKVEFRRRNGEAGFAAERVPGSLVDQYGLRPPLVQHYLLDAATEQKVLALADRSHVQTRDVFDLELLLRRHGAGVDDVDGRTRDLAAVRALELQYEAFRDQVLPFLDPEDAEPFESEDEWNLMRDYVAERLLGEQQ